MAWTASESKIFSAFVTETLNGTALDLNTDAIKVALFNNSVTPAQGAVVGSAGYNLGTWLTANEIFNGGWASGGVQLTSVASSFASNVYTFDAADTPNPTAATLTNAFGALVYDDTAAGKNAVSYHAFSGAQSVSSGTLTILWNTSGIFTLTL